MIILNTMMSHKLLFRFVNERNQVVGFDKIMVSRSIKIYKARSDSYDIINYI